jgi:hypothetical protein
MNTNHATQSKVEVLEVKFEKVELSTAGISSTGRYFNKV